MWCCKKDREDALTVWAFMYGLETSFVLCKELVSPSDYTKNLPLWYDVKPHRQWSRKTISVRWAVWFRLPRKVVRNLKYFGHGRTTTSPTSASGQHVMLSHCLLQPGEKRKAAGRTSTSGICWMERRSLGRAAVQKPVEPITLVQAPFGRKSTEIFSLKKLL